MRVLIAADDRDAIMTLGILLRSEGHEVWSAQGAAEVADAVREFKPDLVLLDVALGERSGYELAAELSREHGSDCPVLVALTGRGDGADRVRAEKCGFQHLVVKPYDADEMLGLLSLVGQ